MATCGPKTRLCCKCPPNSVSTRRTWDRTSGASCSISQPNANDLYLDAAISEDSGLSVTAESGRPAEFEPAKAIASIATAMMKATMPFPLSHVSHPRSSSGERGGMRPPTGPSSVSKGDAPRAGARLCPVLDLSWRKVGFLLEAAPLPACGAGGRDESSLIRKKVTRITADAALPLYP